MVSELFLQFQSSKFFLVIFRFVLKEFQSWWWSHYGANSVYSLSLLPLSFRTNILFCREFKISCCFYQKMKTKVRGKLYECKRSILDSCVIVFIHSNNHPSKTQTINVFNSSRHAVHIFDLLAQTEPSSEPIYKKQALQTKI